MRRRLRVWLGTALCRWGWMLLPGDVTDRIDFTVRKSDPRPVADLSRIFPRS